MASGDYDVIVVGAGVGGITAASLLAKSGLHVLVLDRNYLPGVGCPKPAAGPCPA
jgi:phytoene dehydrogenase-like protein